MTLKLSRFHWWNQVCSGLSNGQDVCSETRNVSSLRLPWSRIEANEIDPARDRFTAAGLMFSGILWMPHGYLAREVEPEGLLPLDQYALAGPDSPTREGFETIESYGLDCYIGCLDSARPPHTSDRAFVRSATADLIRLGFGLYIDRASRNTTGWQGQALHELARKTNGRLGVEGSLDSTTLRALRLLGVTRWLVEEGSAAPIELTGSKMPQSIIAANQEAGRAALADGGKMGIEPIMLCRKPETLKWAHENGWSAAADWKTLDASGITLGMWGKEEVGR